MSSMVAIPRNRPLRVRGAMKRLAVLAMTVLMLATSSPAALGAAHHSLAGPTTTTVEEGYTLVEGRKAGAFFAAIRPDKWNGKLVLLMHGSAPPNQPVALPPFGHEPLWSDLIDRLVSEGYGVAYSSYRVNGFAVQEGMIDTRVAQAMFTVSFGRPDDTYLIGISMGTAIGQKLLETSSARYDGFLAICSALGGATLQNDYFFNARILFDYYFPDALPGDVASRTDLDFESVVLPAVVGAVTESPEAFQKAVELAGINQLEIPWTTPDELVAGIALSLLAAGGGTGDFQAKTGGFPFDNMRTRYTGSSNDDALNASVERYAADPQAAQYMRRFDPNGRLRGTPVLALHTTRDPAVQHQFHFPAYQAILAETGNAHLFETRLVDRFGHCSLSTDEIFEAFQDVVDWSATGRSLHRYASERQPAGVTD